MKTIEDIQKYNKYQFQYNCYYIVTDKKNKLVFSGNIYQTASWVRNNCYKKIEFGIYADYPSWASRIPEWIINSIEKNQKYKGFKFHYYDNKWKRKLIIDKLLHENN